MKDMDTSSETNRNITEKTSDIAHKGSCLRDSLQIRKQTGNLSPQVEEPQRSVFKLGMGITDSGASISVA